MVRGCLPSESVSARGAGDGARCACGRRASELLYSQRLRAFLPHITHPIVLDQYDLCALV